MSCLCLCVSISVHVCVCRRACDKSAIRVRVCASSNGTSRADNDTDGVLKSKQTDDLSIQWKRRTILTVEASFPHLKRRLEVVSIKEIDFSPIERAIDEIKVIKPSLIIDSAHEKLRIAAEEPATGHASGLQQISDHFQGYYLLGRLELELGLVDGRQSDASQQYSPADGHAHVRCSPAAGQSGSNGLCEGLPAEGAPGQLLHRESQATEDPIHVRRLSCLFSLAIRLANQETLTSDIAGLEMDRYLVEYGS